MQACDSALVPDSHPQLPCSTVPKRDVSGSFVYFLQCGGLGFCLHRLEGAEHVCSFARRPDSCLIKPSTAIREAVARKNGTAIEIFRKNCTCHASHEVITRLSFVRFRSAGLCSHVTVPGSVWPQLKESLYR